MPTVPDESLLEPVTIVPHEVTGTPLTIEPHAIDILIDIPAGTTALIKTGVDAEENDITMTRSGVVGLNSNGRALSNEFTISRASGSGTILVVVARVTGR